MNNILDALSIWEQGKFNTLINIRKSVKQHTATNLTNQDKNN